MRRNKYYYGRKRRKIKYKNILLLLVVILTTFFTIPRVLEVSKGYSLIASNNLVMNKMDLEYYDSINEIFSSKAFQKEKIDVYIEVAEYINENEYTFSTEDPTNYINRMIDEKGYSVEVAKVLVTIFDDAKLEITLNDDKKEIYEEIIAIDFFKPVFFDEYIAYYKTFRKTAYKIVLEVNMRINFEPFDVNVINYIERIDGYDQLINHFNKLPINYVPNLSRLSGPNFITEIYLESDVAEAYEAMRLAAAEENYHIGARNGYRTMEYQLELYNDGIKKYLDQGFDQETSIKKAREYIAVPGHSEHQTGFAIDWFLPWDDYCKSGKCLSTTKAYSWLLDNMADYGFILRYPAGKEKYTMIAFEPWHLRYVGVDVARVINEQKITLEEWYAMGKKLD